MRRTLAFAGWGMCVGWLATGARAETVVVDNTDSGFSVVSGAAWGVSSGAGQYGADYRFRNTNDSVAVVEWRAPLAGGGLYEVAVWYRSTGVGRPNNARYTVSHSGGATDVIVNQQTNGARWVSLGAFNFTGGADAVVTLTSAAAPGKNIIADAVRFSADPLPAPLFTEQGAAVLGGVALDARSGSFADSDNDGDLDLLTQGPTASRRLYRNGTVGGGGAAFTDVSSLLHPNGNDIPSWSAAWGDYDGDGDVDVFVGQSNPGNERGDLLRNDGAAGFTDVSQPTGLDDAGFHQNVAWCDIDSDRDLDLLIGMEGPELHEIYLQDAAGHFTAVGAAVGFQQPFGAKAYGMAVGDTDGDGDLDVYISTCRADNNIRNNFYENQLVETGALGFVDIADVNGTQFMTNSYGAEFHDFDDDGDLDLFMVGADQQPSKIWRNDGGNLFTDVDTLTGHPLLSNVGGDLNGGRAIDYDNDGDLDLFCHDHRPLGGADNARVLYRNDGNWEFSDVTVEVGLWHFCEGGYDSAWGDFDLDGDLDLYAATAASWPERFFVSSASENGNHWLYVRLSGPRDNTTAIGAQLYATIHAGTPAERTLRRDANTNAGTFNQSDTPVHFGLGAATAVDTLRIVWPNGTTQIVRDVAADQLLTIDLPGDCDDDGDVDFADFAQMVWCIAPGAPVSTPCVCADFDGSGEVSLLDYAEFQTLAGP